MVRDVEEEKGKWEWWCHGWRENEMKNEKTRECDSGEEKSSER